MRAYQGIADQLVRLGVDTVFAVMGDGNLHLLAELGELGVRIVHARHEQGAVAMADGYSRFSGKVGVATVTHGPGLTNTATSLATAAAHRSRVLVIAGALAAGDVDNLQKMDQPFFTRSLGARSYLLSSPRRARRELNDCFRLVQNGEGTVVLHAPVDVQQAEAEPELEVVAVPPLHRSEPDPAAVSAVVDRLIGAQSAVLLAGRGASTDRAIAALTALAEHLGVPIVTSLLGKGNFSGTDWGIGAVGGLGSPDATRALAAADVICAFGASLNDWTTSKSDFAAGAALIQIDHDPLAIGRFTAPEVAIVADTALSAEAALDRARQVQPDASPRVAPVRRPPSLAPAPSPAGTVDPIYACYAIGQALPPSHALVVDGGHACIWGTQLVDVRTPRSFTHTFSFGSIGQSLGVAVGGCFALEPGRRMTVVLGDGSAAMSLYEWDTFTRYGLPITLIILNDDGFGIERHALNLQGLPPDESDYPGPDFAAIARSMGDRAVRIESVEQLEGLEGVLRESSGPVVLDVRIDGSVVSDTYRHIKQALPD